MNYGLQIVAAKESVYSRGLEIHIFARQPNGVFAGSVVMTEVKDLIAPAAPACRIDPETAQGLMDSLWQCGLRPSEGTGSAGSLAATEKHLGDMRKLVEKTLDVKL